MFTVAFYNTKPYDRRSFQSAADADNLTWRWHEFRLTAESASTAQGAQAVCVFVNDKLDRPCLEELQAAGVRLILLRCAGFNHVDLKAAKSLGLQVARVPAYSPHAVAEHTVGLLLALNRKIHRAYQRVRDGNFSLEGLVGFDLYGKTAGLIGTGKIGRLTAEILRGFGLRVLAHDASPQADWAKQHQVQYVDLPTLLAESQVVSLHAPLTPETHHLLHAETLAQMQPGALLLNTSRGALIDTKALIQSLKRGHLGGVALDVYEEEQGIFFEDHSGEVLQDDQLTRLLSFPHVLITSHQAFLTHEALGEIARVTIANALRFAQGEPPTPKTALA